MINKITTDFGELSAFENFARIQQLTKPLRHLNIHMFNYLELAANDTIYWLGDNENYFHSQSNPALFLKQHPFLHSFTNQTRWYLWAPFLNLEEFTHAVKFLIQLKRENGISYVNYKPALKRIYSFSSKDSGAFYFQVFQARHNLIQFIHYFNQHLKEFRRHLIGYRLPREIIDYHQQQFPENYLDDFDISQKLFLHEIKGSVNPHTAFANRYNFTPRETECLHLLLKGYSAKLIARQLAISVRTIEKHIENIRAKTGCNSVIDLIHKLETDVNFI